MASSLAGKRIVVTASADKSSDLAARLAGLGATAIVAPMVELRPLPAPELDDALRHLDRYAWLIFTSGAAVNFFFRRAQQSDHPLSLPPLAVSGAATARKLEQEFGISPHLVPAVFVGEALVAGLGDLRGKRVLLPRSRLGRQEIVDLLIERGAQVDEVHLYETVAPELGSDIAAAVAVGVDGFTFASPSSVNNLCTMLLDAGIGLQHLHSAVIACIGPITAEAARAAGLSVAVIPCEHTVAGLVTALESYLAGSRSC